MTEREMVVLKVKRARENGLPPPAYQTLGAACFDLSADLTLLGYFAEIPPGARRWFPVGWCFEIPPGYEMQVRGRSGLAFRENIIVHHLGTIDPDYRGEVQVGLENGSSEPFVVSHGLRIAQAKIAPVPRVSIVDVEDGALSDTARGAKGFGSTGVEAADTCSCGHAIRLHMPNNGLCCAWARRTAKASADPACARG